MKAVMNRRHVTWMLGILLLLGAALLAWRLQEVPATALPAGASQAKAPVKWPHGTRLVVFVEEGCKWCKMFHEEVGPIYAKTDEGRQAPLMVVDIFDPRPAELQHVGEILYTPTFVLIDDDGRVVGRIEGYPGYDFFWLRLGKLLQKMKKKKTGNREEASRR